MKSLLVVLALFFCLLMSNVANAQCAWVLWQKIVIGEYEKPSGWLPERGFPTYDACKRNKI